jgi:hypothetical protein
MTLVARRWRGQSPLLVVQDAISTAVTVCPMMGLADVEPLVVDQL